MPITDADVRRLIGSKNARFGNALLTDGSAAAYYYGARATLLDGSKGTPDSLTGLKLWYDFTALGLADGAAITSVTDLSASGWNLSVNAGTPTYKTNVANGLGAANVDSGRSLKNASVSVAGPYSVLLMMQKSSDSGTQAMWSDSATDPLLTWSTTTLSVDPGTTVLNFATVSGTSTHYLLTTIANGQTQLFVDSSTAGASNASVTASTMSGLLLGVTSGGTGSTVDTYLLEMAVWDHVLNGTEIGQLLGYINPKYALSLT